MNPIIADNKPAAVTLTAGEEVFFCACGKSSSQPFCDGSHAGSGITPKAFTPEESGEAYLCQCKHSGNLPFCDGTHKQFSADQVGTEGPGVQSTASDAAPVATPTAEEPTVAFIHQLAREGLPKHLKQQLHELPQPQNHDTYARPTDIHPLPNPISTHTTSNHLYLIGVDTKKLKLVQRERVHMIVLRLLPYSTSSTKTHYKNRLKEKKSRHTVRR